MIRLHCVGAVLMVLCGLLGACGDTARVPVASPPILTATQTTVAPARATVPATIQASPMMTAARSTVIPATAIPRTGDAKDLLLATTTSTQDSGLLDELIPRFEQQRGYRVKVIAVGSGAAIQLGQRGEVDVVLAHAPANERTFVQSGAGVDRKLVMYNDFIIVGPTSDPAGIKGQKDALAAMQAIATKGSSFISRGDNSGTQQLELQLWKAAKVTPQGQNWYVESGTGMGQTLQIADQRNAYTISDRATYLANKDKLALEILVEGDARLLNVYHVILVNKATFPAVNDVGAHAFSDFLLSSATQEEIGMFNRAKYNQALFTPCANNSCKLANPD